MQILPLGTTQSQMIISRIQVMHGGWLALVNFSAGFGVVICKGRNDGENYSIPLAIALSAMFAIVILTVIIGYCVISLTRHRKDFEPRSYPTSPKPDVFLSLPLPNPPDNHECTESTDSTQHSQCGRLNDPRNRPSEHRKSRECSWNRNCSIERANRIIDQSILLRRKLTGDSFDSHSGELGTNGEGSMLEKYEDVCITISPSYTSESQDIQADEFGSTDNNTTNAMQLPMENDLRPEKARRLLKRDTGVAPVCSPQASPRSQSDNSSEHIEDGAPVNEIAIPCHTPTAIPARYLTPTAMSSEAISFKESETSSKKVINEDCRQGVIHISNAVRPSSSAESSKGKNTHFAPDRIQEGLNSTKMRTTANDNSEETFRSAHETPRKRYPSSGAYSSQTIEFTPTLTENLSSLSRQTNTKGSEDGQCSTASQKSAI